MTPTAEIAVEVFGRTDIGLVREHNEDNYLVADLTRHERSLRPEARRYPLGDGGALFVVCDGMGGAVCGEVASQMAIDTIYELMQGAPPGASREVFSRRLRGAVQEANRRIFAYARADHSRAGMGTTCTAAGLVDGTLVFAQIGDSRGYVLRRGKMVQATRDQSLANQLIEAGQMTPEEAREFEHANIILQALGVMERVDVVLTEVPLRRGDLVMLCSDGLSGPVPDCDIEVLLGGAPDPMDACRRLTEASRTNGAPDNITVIVGRFGGAALPEPADGEVVRYQVYQPGPGEGDELDVGLAAANVQAAAAAAAPPAPAASAGSPDPAGAPLKATLAGFPTVAAPPTGAAPAAPPLAGAAPPAQPAPPVPPAPPAPSAPAAHPAPAAPPVRVSAAMPAGPASGLTMVPGAMTGWVPPTAPPMATAPPPMVPPMAPPMAPPPMAPPMAPPMMAPPMMAPPMMAPPMLPAPPLVATVPPGPITVYGAPPVRLTDDELVIPRRKVPVVPIIIFVALVVVLGLVGGFFLYRHEAREGDPSRPAPAAPPGAKAADPTAAPSPVDAVAPPASQAASQPASSRSTTQAATRPSTQPAAGE